VAVRVLNLKQTTTKLKHLILHKIPGSTILADVGAFSMRRIQSFTRRGLSLPNGGPFKKVSPGYARRRTQSANSRLVDKKFFLPRIQAQRARKRGSVVSTPTRRSNLTFTGQLLKALNYKVNKTVHAVTVFVEKTKRKYGGTKKTNADVAKLVSEGGREFLGLDKKAKQQIEKMFLRHVRRSIRKSGL